ncbi:MAG: hypothetical protein Q9172_005136 [Xanthocarpia lactea]
MWPSSPNLFTLIGTLLIFCLEKVPTSSAFPASTSENKGWSSLNNLYACFDTGTTVRRRAKFNDCARAAAKLPNLVEAKTFHRGEDSDNDPYALPKVMIHNSCQIKIDLRFGRSDESSWLGINVATSKIMAACSSGYGQYTTTGGETFAGTGGFIVVTVERTLGQLPDQATGGNDTAMATQ